MSLQDLPNDTHSFDPTSSHEDFMEQMLCGLQPGVSWPDISISTVAGGGVDLFVDQSAFLTTKLRQHQISAGPGLFEIETADAPSFKLPAGDNSIQAHFNGFTGSLQSNQYPPSSFGSPVPATASINKGLTSVGATAAAAAGGGGTPVQPRQRVRARRGQATDPHSIAERLRRERIAERMKSLQELVTNANKTDKASMLDEIIDYVKFLQLQVKVLSMSRMGGVSAVAPLVADTSSEGGHDGVQPGVGGGAGNSNNGTTSSSNNETMTIAENQVVKLMEDDMGSAMQYLQGKGLCLMPISLAATTSTATCHFSTAKNYHPSSPSLFMLSVQSAKGLLLTDTVSVKDPTSASNS